MSVSGIGPSCRVTAEFGPAGTDLKSDSETDLEYMIDHLQQLPNVCVLARALGESEQITTTVIELEIEWPLDNRSPLLDFVSQLLDLLRLTTTAQGVVLNRQLTSKLNRIARHSTCVADSLESVRRSEKRDREFDV